MSTNFPSEASVSIRFTQRQMYALATGLETITGFVRPVSMESWFEEIRPLNLARMRLLDAVFRPGYRTEKPLRMPVKVWLRIQDVLGIIPSADADLADALVRIRGVLFQQPV